MNTTHRNRQKMFHKLSSHLAEHRTQWENESLLSGEIDHFISETQRISQLLADYESLSKAFGEIRDNEREEFNERLVQLAGVLHAFSSEAGKEDTAYLVDLSLKELMRNGLEKSVIKAQSILSKAEEFSAEFDSHPTAKACLAKAQESYERFRKIRFLPSDRRTQRKLLKVKLETKQDELLEFLRDRLDMKMRVFMDLDRDFYNGYAEVRSTKISVYYKKKEEPSESTGTGSPTASEGNSSPPAASGGSSSEMG